MAASKSWPAPVNDEPSPETLAAWKDRGGTEATDGCWLEADEAECPHGHPSWAVVLGLMPEHGEA